MLNHRIEYLAPALIKDRERSWRLYPREQLAFLRESISKRGIVEPPLIDADDRIVCGGLIVQAARDLGLNEIPILRVESLSAAELRLYAIAASRIAGLGEIDEGLLGEELRELEKLIDTPDFSSIGFTTAELDRLLQLISGAVDFDEDIPARDSGRPVSTIGDVWTIGAHRLVCGDALLPASFNALMLGELARFTLSDVPYNLPAADISGHGRFKHTDFVMAAGEMSPAEFTRFLTKAMRNISAHSVEGSLHAFFMSYHFLLELLRAGSIVFGRPKAVCTWVKRQGGQGALFRSQTEFVTYFKKGSAKHRNNVMLGKYGRNRTTAWMFDGMNTPSAERDALLSGHPTPKPVDLLREAILDVTARGEIVLDPFAGSGSLILAADGCERRAFCMELDPLYVDVTLRRCRNVLCVEPVRSSDGRTLAEVEGLQCVKETADGA